MLSSTKTKCPYCSKISYFYIFVVEAGHKSAIYTQCPHCKAFVDIWYLARKLVANALKAILAGEEPAV